LIRLFNKITFDSLSKPFSVILILILQF